MTDEPPACGHTVPRPVFTTDRYTSPELLQREKERVFRRTWIAAARESDIGRPGDRLPFDELGESLFVVRDEDGLVRTFRNSCQHRGTRLVSRRCGGPRITCPYHGWTYGLDGRLVGIPKKAGFEGLDRDTHGLIGLRTECWGGFVWITFNPEAPPVADYLGTLAVQLAPYRLADMQPLLQRTWTLGCNWKAVLDQATETYHVESVHGRSVGRFVDTAAETVAAFHGFDPHHLQTLPVLDSWWRSWLDRWSVPADLEVTPDQLRLLHKYVVFPNTVINVLPYHLTVFRVFPITPDTCRLHYGFYIRKRPGLIAFIRSGLTLLASLYILWEDVRMLPSFQSGVNAAGNRPIEFHREERPLEYFHSVVDRYVLGDRDGGEVAAKRASS